MTHYCVHCHLPHNSSRVAHPTPEAAWKSWQRKNDIDADELAQEVRRSDAMLAAGETTEAAIEADPLPTTEGKYRGARWWRA